MVIVLSSVNIPLIIKLLEPTYAGASLDMLTEILEGYDFGVSIEASYSVMLDQLPFKTSTPSMKYEFPCPLLKNVQILSNESP